MTYVVI